MLRSLSLLIVLLTFHLLSTADEPPPAKSEKGKLDPAKLKALLGKRKGDSADLSNWKKMTWKIGDVTREALVYFPPTTDKSKKPPLVFAFHGHGGKMEFSARKLAFHEVWPEAICVYPQGLPTPVPVIDVDGKKPGWQKFIGDQKDRDLDLFDAILKSMKTEHNIDEKRVYSAGHSNGGFFSYVLWAARGDTLAAVAPIAAATNPRDFHLQKPKPVMHIAGENDSIVKFSSQQKSIEQIKKLNGCEPEGQTAGKMGLEFRSKSNGPPVVTYIHPGNHGIPDDAVVRIAEFFKKHALK